MFRTVNKLSDLLDANLKMSTGIIFVLIIISMIIETFSIGLIIPAITLLSESNLAEKYPYISKVLASISPFKLFSSNNLNEIRNQDIIAGGMIIFLAVYIIKAVYLLFFHIIKGKFIYELQHSLSKKFIEGYLKLPFSFFSNKNSSELIRKIAYETLTLSIAVDFFLILLTELLVLIGIISLLVYVQPVIAIIVLFIFGIATYYFHIVTKQKISNQGKMRTHYEESRLNFLNQILGGIKEIKIYNIETEFVKDYLSTSKQVFKSNKFMSILSAIPKLWLELIAVFSLTILLFILISNSKEQIPVITTLALFAGAAFRLLPSINRAIGSFQKIKYYLPIIDTLHKEFITITSKSIEKSYTKINFSKSLTLDKVSFSYEGSGKKILDKINLNIPKFSILGLKGQTGTGKSTLANILAGLLDFNEGKLILNDIELKEKRINWGNKIGFVPQNVFLTNNTIKKNIAFGIPNDEIDNSKIDKAVNFAQLNKMIKNLSKGLDTFVGERGVKLSGGQIQRIGIARALYSNPDFLIFDEATSALDIDTEKEIMNLIKKISKEKTIFIISHRTSVLKYCDKIYQLEEGKLNEVKIYNN